MRLRLVWNLLEVNKNDDNANVVQESPWEPWATAERSEKPETLAPRPMNVKPKKAGPQKQVAQLALRDAPGPELADLGIAGSAVFDVTFAHDEPFLCRQGSGGVRIRAAFR